MRAPGRFPVGAFGEDGSRHPWFDGACLVLLYEGEQILYSFEGESGTRPARLQRGLICRSYGDAQLHGAGVAHEHELSAIAWASDRNDLKSPAEQWMGGIGYFDDVRRHIRRVVERGIIGGFRSTRFHTTSCWPASA